MLPLSSICLFPLETETPFPLISRVSSLAVKIYSAVEASVSSNLKALLNPTCVVCPKPPHAPSFNHNHNCSALRVGRIWWSSLISSHVLHSKKKTVFVLHFFNTYYFILNRTNDKIADETDPHKNCNHI